MLVDKLQRRQIRQVDLAWLVQTGLDRLAVEVLESALAHRADSGPNGLDLGVVLGLLLGLGVVAVFGTPPERPLPSASFRHGSANACYLGGPVVRSENAHRQHWVRCCLMMIFGNVRQDVIFCAPRHYNF